MITFKNVSFFYETQKGRRNGVKDINLTIASGECVVFCGKSGCGKTTLTRLLNGLIPHFYKGSLSGTVSIDTLDIATQSLAQTATFVGSVFQNPRSQFFNVDTTSELAFGCENQGLPVEQIHQRMNDAKQMFNLNDLMDRSIFELSGGEKQRIACGSVYAVYPDIYVLDEPSSNLDAASIENLRKVIAQLKALGKTIILSEHRLYYLTGLADKFYHMANGVITTPYKEGDLQAMGTKVLGEMGLRGLDLRVLKGTQQERHPDNQHKKTLTLDNLICQYKGKTALSIPKLTLNSGEIIGVIGANGSGKSTFAGCLCGILKHKGTVLENTKSLKRKERIKKSYMVMQDVNHQLFTESLLEELTLNMEQADKKAENILESLGLLERKEDHPLSLSGGQKQRVAIGSAMCSKKEYLIYDEPTSGLDYQSMKTTCHLIKVAAKDAFISIVITHDLEFILTACTSILHIADGQAKEYYPLNESGIKKVKDFFLTLKKGE